MFIDGKDLTPLFNESKEFGFNLWRVFFMGSIAQNTILQLDPRGLYSRVKPFANLLNTNGIINLATVNVDAQDIMPNASDRQANWINMNSQLEGTVSIISGGNEWSK